MGYEITDKGISTQDRLVKGLEEWPQPQNVKEVMGFLGIAGFYRKFVKNFAAIAKPLT